MEKKSKSVRKMELVILRKTGCFGIQNVHKVSNHSDDKESNSYLYSKKNSSKKVSVLKTELVVPKTDHKEIPISYERLYSEKYSIDNRGHNSLMISGLLMLSCK